MRRLLSPLTRRLDRRIDARIAEILSERHRRAALGVEPGSLRDRFEDRRRIWVLEGMLTEARMAGLSRLVDVIREEIAWTSRGSTEQAPVPKGQADLVAEATRDIESIGADERNWRGSLWMGV